jgi:hypothetical protein
LTLSNRGEAPLAVTDLRTDEPAFRIDPPPPPLGSILDKQLHAADRACAQWIAHRERFSGGRYAEDVDRAIRRLGCAPASNDRQR